MSILSLAKTVDTGIRRPVTAPLTVDWRCDRTPGEPDYSGGVQHQYRLHITVECVFWADKARVEEAGKMAQRVMLHKLYGDTLARVDAAMHAVANGDREEALSTLADIRRELVA